MPQLYLRVKYPVARDNTNISTIENFNILVAKVPHVGVYKKIQHSGGILRIMEHLTLRCNRLRGVAAMSCLMLIQFLTVVLVVSASDCFVKAKYFPLKKALILNN